jgi:hypothetical protein
MMGDVEKEPLWTRAAGRVLYHGEEFLDEHGAWMLGLLLVVAIVAVWAAVAGFGATGILFVSALLLGFGLLVGGLLGRD